MHKLRVTFEENKVIRFSPPPPRVHAFSPGALELAEPGALRRARVPAEDKALCCWRQPGVPRCQGTAGRAAGGGGSTVDPSLVDQQNPSISHCEGSRLVQRFRKLFNPACVKLLLPEGIQIGSPIRPLRGALV